MRRRGHKRGHRKHDKKPHHGKRRKRPLARGEMPLLLLNIIAQTPNHGYGLISSVAELTNSAYVPSAGMIYPAIEGLQTDELITSNELDGKRVLSVTDYGREVLEEEAEWLEAIYAKLDKLAKDDAEVDPTNVKAALDKLKHTTRQTVELSKDEENTRLEAVKILTEARSKIAALLKSD